MEVVARSLGLTREPLCKGSHRGVFRAVGEVVYSAECELEEECLEVERPARRVALRVWVMAFGA